MTTDLDAQLRRLDRTTAQHRALQVAEHAVANLRTLRSTGAEVVCPSRAWAGRVVVLCGAGPSLDAHLDALAAWRHVDPGGVLVAVNTIAPALLAAGVTPTCVVTLEGLPVLSQIAPLLDSDAELVADVTAHPETVAAVCARRRQGRLLIGAQPMLLGVACAIGATPVRYGSSATTAALALALARGATRIGLVGLDLCYADDGRTYATGSAWGEMRYSTDGQRHGHDWLRFHGAPERDALHEAGSLPPVPRQRTAFRVPTDAGGEAWCTLELEDQRRWFAATARALEPPIVRVGGGARIDGTIPLATLAAGVLRLGASSPGAADGPLGARCDLAAWEPLLRDEAERAERFATAMLDGDACEAMRLAAGGMPFVEGVAAGDVVGLQRTTTEARWKRRGIYLIWQEAARWTRRRLDAST